MVQKDILLYLQSFLVFFFFLVFIISSKCQISLSLHVEYLLLHCVIWRNAIGLWITITRDKAKLIWKTSGVVPRLKMRKLARIVRGEEDPSI